jgi:hypothetical protein
VQKLLFSSATGRRVQPSRPPRRRILRGFAACCLPALQRALRAIRSVALHNARCCSQRAALIIASHLMRHAELDGESVSAVLNWVLGTPSTHSFGCLVLRVLTVLGAWYSCDTVLKCLVRVSLGRAVFASRCFRRAGYTVCCTMSVCCNAYIAPCCTVVHSVAPLTHPPV